jgi:hypothetical protein
MESLQQRLGPFHSHHTLEKAQLQSSHLLWCPQRTGDADHCLLFSSTLKKIESDITDFEGKRVRCSRFDVHRIDRIWAHPVRPVFSIEDGTISSWASTLVTPTNVSKAESGIALAMSRNCPSRNKTRTSFICSSFGRLSNGFWTKRRSGKTKTLRE